MGYFDFIYLGLATLIQCNYWLALTKSQHLSISNNITSYWRITSTSTKYDHFSYSRTQTKGSNTVTTPWLKARYWNLNTKHIINHVLTQVWISVLIISWIQYTTATTVHESHGQSLICWLYPLSLITYILCPWCGRHSYIKKIDKPMSMSINFGRK